MSEERYIYPDREGSTQPSVRRRKKKQPFSAVCPLIICLFLGAIVFLIWCLISPPGKKQGEETPPVPVIETQNTVPGQSELTPVQTEVVPTETAASAETTEAMTTTETEPPTLGFETVDESYFDDALFIGDSRTDGLRLYSPFEGATYYYKTSLSIFNAMDSTETCDGCYGIRQLLQNRTYGKIYIMFGINEAYSDKQSFLDRYEKVIDEIRSYQPDALIYIQSIMYVTAKKMANDPGFSNDGLRAKNEGLKAMANGKDIFYLEVNDALNDGAGNLPGDYTNDGVHLKPEYYHLWSDFLLKNAIVLPGSREPVPEDTGRVDTLPVETKPTSDN